MNMQSLGLPAGRCEGSPAAVRAVLHLPRPLPGSPDQTSGREAVRRSVARWALCYALAIGALVVVHWTQAPDAAAPIETRPANVESDASQATREWYLPAVLFNDYAQTAEPIATF